MKKHDKQTHDFVIEMFVKFSNGKKFDKNSDNLEFVADDVWDILEHIDNCYPELQNIEETEDERWMDDYVFECMNKVLI